MKLYNFFASKKQPLNRTDESAPLLKDSGKESPSQASRSSTSPSSIRQEGGRKHRILKSFERVLKRHAAHPADQLSIDNFSKSIKKNRNNPNKVKLNIEALMNMAFFKPVEGGIHSERLHQAQQIVQNEAFLHGVSAGRLPKPNQGLERFTSSPRRGSLFDTDAREFPFTLKNATVSGQDGKFNTNVLAQMDPRILGETTARTRPRSIREDIEENHKHRIDAHSTIRKRIIGLHREEKNLLPIQADKIPIVIASANGILDQVKLDHGDVLAQRRSAQKLALATISHGFSHVDEKEKLALAIKLISLLPHMEFHEAIERDAQRRGVETLEMILNNISNADDKKQVLIALTKQIPNLSEGEHKGINNHIVDAAQIPFDRPESSVETIAFTLRGKKIGSGREKWRMTSSVQGTAVHLLEKQLGHSDEMTPRPHANESREHGRYAELHVDQKHLPHFSAILKYANKPLAMLTCYPI